LSIDRLEGSELLEVVTGSRLHFGLLELAAGQPLRYGGLGLMLDEPGWVLRFTDSSTSTNSSPAAVEISPDISERIEKVRTNLSREFGQLCNVKIDVLQPLPLHSGLGAGTQLATAVAFGLSLISQQVTEPKVEELAARSGRGKRSGIGLFGFVHGGLILDQGHTQESVRTIRATSVNLHPQWRVVLITPDQATGVTGGHEASLLERIGQTPNSECIRMVGLAKIALDSASRPDGFSKFTSVLQEYVDAAGRLFSAGQGGMYNGAAVTHAVELARASGLRAVGQSSWGPAVFGFAENPVEATQIATRLTEVRPSAQWQIRICTPARQGASWRWIEE
jgi:beta-ribofuranosylaminobenzene 5'-phosphate synthase